jgi:hypothetical protein
MIIDLALYMSIPVSNKSQNKSYLPYLHVRLRNEFLIVPEGLVVYDREAAISIQVI